MTGVEYGDFMLTQVLPCEPSAKYSIFMSGLDLWDHSLVEVLFERAESELDSTIVYTDTWSIDKDDKILSRYQGIFQTKEVGKPFIPIQVFLSLSHNIVFGGLWRELIQRKVEVRHR